MDERKRLLLDQLKLSQEKIISDFNLISLNAKEMEFLMFKTIVGLASSFKNVTKIDRAKLMICINEELIEIEKYLKKNEVKVKKKKKQLKYT